MLLIIVSNRIIVKPKKYSYFKDFINTCDFITNKNMKVLILAGIYYKTLIKIIS